MRADECTGVALDTVLCLPLRNLDCDTSLFVSRSTGRNGSVSHFHECAYRKSVSALCIDHIGDVLYELRCETVLVRVLELGCDVFPVCRDLYLDILSASVYCRVVHLHDILAFLPVALLDSLLHVSHGVLVRDDTGDLEEC